MPNRLKAILSTLVLFAPSISVLSADTFDLVIQSGRVLDPETPPDAQHDIGIRGARIVTIGETPLTGNQIIDARGNVVSPGFIDIHSHSPTLLGQHRSLHDGMTSQLELGMGAWPVKAYGDPFTGSAQINFSASVSHTSVRIKVIEHLDQPYAFVGQKIAISITPMCNGFPPASGLQSIAGINTKKRCLMAG